MEYSQFFACSWFGTYCIVSRVSERNYIDCSVSLTNYLGDGGRRNREFSIDKHRNLSLSLHIHLYILHTQRHQRENVLTEKFNSVYADIFAIFLERMGKKRN